MPVPRVSMASDASLASAASMAVAAFWLAAAATAVGVLALLLPHSPRLDEAGLAAVTGGAATLAGGALALTRGGRARGWVFQAGTFAAAALATAAIYFWGEGSLYGPLPYVWVVLYAFLFFELRWALVHMAAVGALFAVELTLSDPPSTPVGAWAVTVATLTSAGLLVSLVRDRLAPRGDAPPVEAPERDALTGLLDRRGFEEALDMEVERARRTDQAVSVILGDLDRFGQVNERVGRGGGDAALRRVAAVIEESKRSWDTGARVGGEEFTLLAPATDEHGAYILAERLRVAILREFEGAAPGPLTASFGIVSWPVHGQTPGALLQAGRQALEAAKQLGCNRSVISSAEVPGILGRAPRHDGAHVELATLLSLAEALDVRDSGTASHCQRVGRYAELIAREIGLPPDSVERVRIAGILHDVGRVGVPDELLERKGPLSEEDWHWIRSHPEIGARMLETTDFADIGEWILAHHERPDGTGYPDGRRDGEVPIESRILGVADAYEAMTAGRPYRQPLDPQAASDELRRGAGRQFDERVVRALLRVV